MKKVLREIVRFYSKLTDYFIKISHQRGYPK